MAGILDSKTRVVDFILTSEGRRQIRNGDLKIEYASFTDRDTFYEEDSDGVATDPTDRIYFESTGRYQDQIVVESRAGVITNFSTADYNLNGASVSTSPVAPREASEELIFTGSQVSNKSSEIITQITKNFYDQEMIANEDVFSARQGFDLSLEEVEFAPDGVTPIRLSAEPGVDPSATTSFNSNNNPPTIDSLPKPITDYRFAHFEQFKFLPPCNLENTELGGIPLGFYPNFNQAEIETYESLKETLVDKEFKEITFDPTSRDNNILIQPFEFLEDEGKVEKLEILDYGLFANESGTSAGVRVFFIGKLVRGDDGVLRFLNLFTMELHVT